MFQYYVFDQNVLKKKIIAFLDFFPLKKLIETFKIQFFWDLTKVSILYNLISLFTRKIE
jgi:hypothetical protein